MIFFLGLVSLWIALGLGIWWWKGRTPAPGSRRLVRTCRRRVVRRGEEVSVELWPSCYGLPAEVGSASEPTGAVLLLDCSSSLGEGPGSGLEAVRTAALSLFHGLASQQCRVAVVIFDELIHVGCEFTSKPGEWVSVIEEMKSGAGTRIDLALGKALALLESCDDLATEVVILLSDGVTDRASAKMAAQHLKERGSRLLTVSVGHGVESSLLAEMASGPQDHLSLRETDVLERIFRAIEGRTEDDFHAEVEETINSRAFAYLGAETITPCTTATDHGSLRWYIPFVDRSSERPIRYRLRARQWGWHRIAESPAQLTLRSTGDAVYEGASNDSPHLLVLPRLLAPWAAPILNPLFWWLFGRFLASDDGAVSHRHHEKPPALPVAEPRSLPFIPVRSGPALAPAMIVGLGSTGGRVLRALRELLADLPEVDASTLRWLWIDTGPAPELDGRNPLWGEPIGEADRILMPENLESFIRRLAEGAEKTVTGLAAEALHEGARPQDFDLSRGSRGRRQLGRAALHHHLAAPRPALEKALDERLLALAEGFRVWLVAGLGGGTGSGMLLDLATYLQGRMESLGRPARSVDALVCLPDVRSSDGQNQQAARNALACAMELSTALHPGASPRAAVPSSTSRDGRRVLDQILVTEQPLEPPTSPHVAALHWAAAHVLLHQTLVPGRGVDRLLEEGRGELRRLSRLRGQAMVTGVSATWRLLPWRWVEAWLSARIAQVGLASALSRLKVPEESAAARERVAQELQAALTGDGLNRRPPVGWKTVSQLAQEETVSIALSRMLRGLDLLPGTAISAETAELTLQAKVLDEQQTQFDDFLEEWSLRLLNGDLGLSGLRTVVASLGEKTRRAIHHLDGLEAAAAREGLVRRHRLVCHLFKRYQQSLRSLGRRADRWWEALAPAKSVQAADQGSLMAVLHRLEVSSFDALEMQARNLGPYTVWSSEIAARLSRRCVDPVQGRWKEYLRWVFSDVGPDSAPRFKFRIADRPPCGPNDGEALEHGLLAVARSLSAKSLSSVGLASLADLRQWLESPIRQDPVRLANHRQSEAAGTAPRHQELWLKPAGEPDVSQSVRSDIETVDGSQQYGTSVVRVMAPCALLALESLDSTTAQVSAGRHADLPWLEVADARAARAEDSAAALGLEMGFLVPVLRGAFMFPEQLRAFCLAAAFGMVERRMDLAGSVLTLVGKTLADATPTPGGNSSVVDALEAFVFSEDIDPTVVDAITSRLSETGDAELRGVIRLDEALGEILVDCPEPVAVGMRWLIRLYVELELDCRQRRQGEVQ